MIIELTKHCLDQVCIRHPKISKIEDKEKQKKKAIMFIRGLFESFYKGEGKRIVNKRKGINGCIVLNDGIHKIVYSRDLSVFVLVTYAYRKEEDIIEGKLLNILSNENRKKRNKNISKYKVIN